jgi:hypothetical protein
LNRSRTPQCSQVTAIANGSSRNGPSRSKSRHETDGCQLAVRPRVVIGCLARQAWCPGQALNSSFPRAPPEARHATRLRRRVASRPTVPAPGSVTDLLLSTLHSSHFFSSAQVFFATCFRATHRIITGPAPRALRESLNPTAGKTEAATDRLRCKSYFFLFPWSGEVIRCLVI